MGKGGTAGATADFKSYAEMQAADSQNKINQQTTANRPDQTNAYGSSVQWTQGPDGQWHMQQSFGGPLAGASQGLQGQVADSFATPLDNGSAARDQAINAAYGQATSRLDPQWNQREDALQTRLLNQGLDPNSEAYKNAASEFGRQRNDAYTSAMNSAIGQGTAAQQATFQQNLAAKQMPLQNLLAMQGLTQMPGFNAAGAAQPTQYLPAAMAWQEAQNAYDENATKERSAAWQGGGQLASAGIGALMAFSDERLKDNIQRHDVEAMPGVPVATWEFKGEPGVVRRGVIAQDLEKVAPEYVRTRPDGLKEVDYSFAPYLYR